MPFCSSCNRNVDDPTDEYCPDRGTRLVKQIPPVNTAMVSTNPTGVGGIVASLRSQLARLSPRAKVVLGIIVLAIIIGGAVAAASRQPGPSPTGNLPWSSYQRSVLTDQPYNAYTWLTPNGWTSTARFANGAALDHGYVHGISLDVKDNTGTMQVFAELPVNPFFIEKGLGCDNQPQGTLCYTYIASQLMRADQYIQNALEKTLQGYGLIPSSVTDWKIVQTSARPDLATKFGILLVTQNGFSGADAVITYKLGGVGYKMGIELATSRNGIDFSIPGLVTIDLWNAVFTGVTAPESSFDTASNAYSRVIIPTIRVDPTWVRSEAAAAGVQTQMIRNWDQRLQAMQLAEFTELSNSQAAQGRAWANALGGVDVYVDKTDGTEYTLPYTLGNYFYHSGNYFYPTNTESQPSDCAQAGNCREVFVNKSG